MHAFDHGIGGGQHGGVVPPPRRRIVADAHQHAVLRTALRGYLGQQVDQPELAQLRDLHGPDYKRYWGTPPNPWQRPAAPSCSVIPAKAGIQRMNPLHEPCLNPLDPPLLGDDEDTQRGFAPLDTPCTVRLRIACAQAPPSLHRTSNRARRESSFRIS